MERARRVQISGGRRKRFVRINCLAAAKGRCPKVFHHENRIDRAGRLSTLAYLGGHASHGQTREFKVSVTNAGSDTYTCPGHASSAENDVGIQFVRPQNRRLCVDDTVSHPDPYADADSASNRWMGRM